MDVVVGDGSGVNVTGRFVAVGKSDAVTCIAVASGCVSTDNTGVQPERMSTTINHKINLFNRKIIIFLIGWWKEGSYGNPPSVHIFDYLPVKRFMGLISHLVRHSSQEVDMFRKYQARLK